MILLDIQKAFDSVHHSILIDSFNSYVENLNHLGGFDHIHEIENKLSMLVVLTLISVIYLLCKGYTFFSKLYAAPIYDAELLLCPTKNPDYIGQLFNNLNKCNKWLVDNKLSLHMGKTEPILFGCRIENYSITCYGQTIQAVIPRNK